MAHVVAAPERTYLAIFSAHKESERRMISWQVIFLPHLLAVVAWLFLCHLQIGPKEKDSNASANTPDSVISFLDGESDKAA